VLTVYQSWSVLPLYALSEVCCHALGGVPDSQLCWPPAGSCHVHVGCNWRLRDGVAGSQQPAHAHTESHMIGPARGLCCLPGTCLAVPVPVLHLCRCARASVC